MLNQSVLFNTEIYNLQRNFTSKVSYYQEDLAAAGDCTVTYDTPPILGWSTQLTNKKTQLNRYFCSWETDYVKLDGTSVMAPKLTDVADTIDQIGIWSSQISNGSGTFVSVPTITLTFANSHTCLGLTIYGDPVSCDYVNSWTITVYWVAGGNTIYNVFPNSANYLFNQQLTAFNKIKMEAITTLNPYRRVHLSQVVFGQLVTWTGGFFNVDLIEELDPCMNTSPAAEFSIEVMNNGVVNPFTNNIQQRQPITWDLQFLLSNGTYENISMGRYYLYNWHSNNNYLTANLYARSILDVMEQGTFHDTSYTGVSRTLATIAGNIIYNFISTSGIYIANSLHVSLGSISTTAPVPYMSYKQALQYVAQMALCVMWVDRNNVLQINPSTSQVASNTMPYANEITLEFQKNYPTVCNQNKFNYFQGSLYTYSNGANTQVYNSSIILNGTGAYTGIVNLNSCILPSSGSSTISGATITVISYYTNIAIVTLSGTPYAVATLTVSGTIINSNSNVITLDKTSGVTPNPIVINNPLITDAFKLQNVLNWLYAEAQNITLYQNNTFGNPALECGDVVTWDTQYLNKYAKIIRQEFTFNGALSAAMNGKGGW